MPSKYWNTYASCINFDIFVEDGIPVIKEAVDGRSHVTALLDGDESVFKKGTTYYVCVRPGVEFNPDFLFLLGKILVRFCNTTFIVIPS